MQPTPCRLRMFLVAHPVPNDKSGVNLDEMAGKNLSRTPPFRISAKAALQKCKISAHAGGGDWGWGGDGEGDWTCDLRLTTCAATLRLTTYDRYVSHVDCVCRKSQVVSLENTNQRKSSSGSARTRTGIGKLCKGIKSLLEFSEGVGLGEEGVKGLYGELRPYLLNGIAR